VKREEGGEDFKMKNKRLFCVAFIIACLASANSAKALETTTISIDPPTYEVAESEIGETFKINITLNDVTNLWSWKVRVNWNSEILNFTEIAEGPFLNNTDDTLFLWAQNWTAIEEGYIPEISCTLLSSVSVNGSGVLATVTFKSLSPGTSNITLTETVLKEPEQGHPEISHTVNNGEVTVIPEFQPWMILPIVLTATAIITLMKKTSKIH
jgi:hypothetical protein